MKTVVYRVVDDDRKEYELFGEFKEAVRRRDALRGRGVSVRLQRKEINIDTNNWIEL